MDFIFRAAEKFLKDHKRLMRYRRVFAVLAAVVVFATTYELILPAITIDRQRAAETPGIEVGVAAEETVESDGMEESAEEEAEAEAEAQAEAEAEAEAEAAAKAQAEAEAEAEATAAEEADAAVAEGDSQTDTAEAEEEAQSKSEEANAAAESSDADISGETISQDTEETADGGNSDQDNADSDAAIAEDETVSQYTGEDSDSTDPAADGSADTEEEENAVTDAAAAGTTAAAEQAIEYPVTLTFEGEDYTITATFDETAELPAGVTLDALEILPDMIYKDADGNVLYDDYEVYLEKTVETLEKDNRLEDTYVASARFFDITFVNQEGYYVEPAAPVTVAVKYKEALSAEDTVNTVAVHFDDKKDKTEIIETEEEVKNKTINEISFDAEKFSIYGLAATQKLETKELTVNGDTYEISVSYNQKAEIPEGAELDAYELMPGTEEYEECAAKSANTDENGETASRFFNISIMVDGAEYEPKAAVDVKITLKDTAPEEVAADKEITHFTNDGDVENIPQEVEKASDGGAEVSFQMDSFSTVEVPLLGASSTSDYTITVGGTVEINGTSSYSSNSWESSDTTIATVSDSSTNTETVTGVSAGTATITHTYYVSKKKTATEEFTVTVEAASDEITETANASDGDIQVSVKRTGSAKKFEGCTLVVEKLSSGTVFEEYAQALTDNGGDVTALKGMYHIYLKDSEENEVSVSNANMEVTITDPILNSLNIVKVGHFKKSSNMIVDKGFADGTSGLKKVTVSDGSITFTIKSFSVITVETIDETLSGSSTGVVTTHTAGGYSGDVVYTDTSSQIDYAYESYAANGSGITKIIDPTTEENVFKVTVNLNRKPTIEDLQKWFQQAGGYVLQSNGSLKNEDPNNTQGGIGDPYEAQAHDYRFYGTDQGTYSVTVHYTIGDETFDVVMYAGSNANTGTYHKVIVPLPNGKWLDILCTNFKKDIRFDDTALNDLNINLTNYATELYKAFAVDFNTVMNTVDTSRFEYLGSTMNGANSSQGVNGSVVSVSAPNGNGEMAVSSLSGLSVGSTDSFSYYVRLKVDGITPMDSSDTWPTPLTGGEYPEGSLYANITAHYTTITENIVNGYVDDSGVTVTKQEETKEFTITRPSVSGELYYVELEKVDSEMSSLKLPNAEFELRDSDGNVKATLSTDSDGKAVSTPGVPYGVYELYETKAPDGYTLTDSENGDLKGTYALAYLGNSTRSDWVHEQLSSKKLGKLLTESNAISNTSIETELTLIKAGSDGTPLTADFTLVSTPKSGSNSGSETISISMGTILTIKGNYTYTLTEGNPPDGYQSVGTLNIYLTKDSNNNLVVQIGDDQVALTKNGNTYTAEYTIIDPLDKVTFKIEKLDSNNNPLGGAGFAIYDWTETTPSEEAVDGYSNLISISTEGDNEGFLALDGTGSTDIELSPGTYALRETNVPEGYVSPGGDWKLEVTATGVSVYAYNRELNNGEGGYSNSPDYTYTLPGPVTVTNNPGRSLPSSGGPGTSIYTIGAMALMALALIASYTLRQRERRYDN